MIEFTDSMSQELKHSTEMWARQDIMIRSLAIEGARHSSLVKNLAKIDMSSIFLEFGKARKE